MSKIQTNPSRNTLNARLRNWRRPVLPPRSLLRMDAFASLSDVDRAYAAGLIEGEGALLVMWVNGQRKPVARMAVKMTDPEPVRWLQSIFGGPIAVIEAYGMRKRSWRWYVHGRLAGAVAASIYSFLRSERRKLSAVRVIRAASLSGWCKGAILDSRRLELIEKVVRRARVGLEDR